MWAATPPLMGWQLPLTPFLGDVVIGFESGITGCMENDIAKKFALIGFDKATIALCVQRIEFKYCALHNIQYRCPRTSFPDLEERCQKSIENKSALVDMGLRVAGIKGRVGGVAMHIADHAVCESFQQARDFRMVIGIHRYFFTEACLIFNVPTQVRKSTMDDAMQSEKVYNHAHFICAFQSCVYIRLSQRNGFSGLGVAGNYWCVDLLRYLLPSGVQKTAPDGGRSR